MKEQLEQIKAKALADLAAAADHVRAGCAARARAWQKGRADGRSEADGRACLPRSVRSWASWRTPVRAKLEDGARAAPTPRWHAAGARVRSSRPRSRWMSPFPANPWTDGPPAPDVNRVLQEVKEIFIGMGYSDRRRPGGGAGHLQLHAAEHPEGAIPPATAQDTFYYRRGRLGPAADPDLPRCRSASWMTAEAAHPHRGSRPGVTARTRPTPPTAPCSIRSRAWWWTRASRWAT